MIRRLACAFAAAGTLLAALMLSGAPTASAAGSCSIVVPQNVSIVKPYTLISATLGADCTASHESWSAWDVRHSYYGPSGMFFFEGTRSDSFGFYDWEHYGTYYVEPSSAYDSSSNSLVQNTRSYYVRSGSRVGISASRTGAYVTLRVATSYYSPALSLFRTWPSEKVTLQARSCSSCAWTSLGRVSTAANATATFRTYTLRSRYFRAVSSATTTVWGATSTTIIR